MKEICGLSVPECWSDVTFERYCNMFANVEQGGDNEVNFVIVACNLLDITPDILMRMKRVDVDEIIATLKFIATPIEPNEQPIEIDGKSYIIPMFDEMPYRQYIDAESELKNITNDYDILRLSCVLLVEAGKEYSPKNVDSMELKLRQMPCTEIVPNILNFIQKKKSLLENILRYSELAEQFNTPTQ